MDRDERLLAQVLRAREARNGHGRRTIRPGSLVLVLLLLVPIAGGVLAFRLLESRAAVADVRATPAAAREPIAAATPVAAATRETQSIRSVPTAPAAAPAASGARRYVVQPGDTVQSIAQRQGLRPATLASVNDLVDPDLLQPGRELLVPAGDGLVHVVQPGETVRTIAEQYGVDQRAIISANDLAAPDEIDVGQRLFVPGATRLLAGQR